MKTLNQKRLQPKSENNSNKIYNADNISNRKEVGLFSFNKSCGHERRPVTDSICQSTYIYV